MRPRLTGVLAAGLLAASGATAAPVINEFVANHAGSDIHEYVDFFGAANTDYSGYRLLQLEGDA